MNKVFLVGGGKGGVGKSMVALSLVDALLTKGEKVLVVESDDSNPDVEKTLRNVTTCAVCNLDTEDGFVKLGDLIEQNPEMCVVVNTAARATKSLIEFGGIITDVAKAGSREVVMLWPINRQRDSVELLKNWLDGSDKFSAKPQTYVLRNTYFGSAEKFSRFSAAENTQARVRGVSDFPELNDLIADKLNDKRLPASAEEGFSIAEKSVLGRYRAAAGKALENCYG